MASNAVGDRVTVVEGDAATLLSLLAPVRVIAANIMASVLLDVWPAIDGALAPGGDVIVGGVLVTERDEFVGALERRGWSVAREDRDGAWWSAHVRRRA